MDQKILKNTGYSISAIGLGCVTFGREIDEETSRVILDYALEKGITFFDTSEAYGGGQTRHGRTEMFGVEDVREMSDEMSSSERILGDWMQDRGCRDEITICTKVASGASPENIKKALTESLERLKTDHVEIYKIHTPDTTVPISETLSGLTDEVNAGRVSVIGGSNYSAEQLQEALAASNAAQYARFDIVQPPYNLVAPEADKDIFPLCLQEGVAVTPYSPLAAGFLTGKYTPDRTTIPEGTRFHTSPAHADVYFSERNFSVVARLKEKSEEIGIPMVRLAMAWTMTHPAVTSTLIGARNIRHIDNAIQAYEQGLDSELRTEMSAWD